MHGCHPLLVLPDSTWHGWRGHATIIQSVTTYLTYFWAVFWVSRLRDAVRTFDVLVVWRALLEEDGKSLSGQVLLCVLS